MLIQHARHQQNLNIMNRKKKSYVVLRIDLKLRHIICFPHFAEYKLAFIHFGMISKRALLKL